MPFALREITSSLFDMSRLVGCYREGRSSSVVVSKIIRFAKQIRIRQKGCLQVCSWEGLPYVCHSSGLQFCPNAFYTTVKRLLLWLITWLGWPWSSPDNLQTPHSRAVWIWAYLYRGLSRLNHTLSSTEMISPQNRSLNYLWGRPRGSIRASFFFSQCCLSLPLRTMPFALFSCKHSRHREWLPDSQTVWICGNQQLLLLLCSGRAKLRT